VCVACMQAIATSCVTIATQYTSTCQVPSLVYHLLTILKCGIWDLLCTSGTCCAQPSHAASCLLLDTDVDQLALAYPQTSHTLCHHPGMPSPPFELCICDVTPNVTAHPAGKHQAGSCVCNADFARCLKSIISPRPWACQHVQEYCHRAWIADHRPVNSALLHGPLPLYGLEQLHNGCGGQHPEAAELWQSEGQKGAPCASGTRA
jgi:hypothetical protein